MLPSIENYGNYSSQNYGANTLCVTVGDIRVWYSYQTPVAFQIGDNEMVVRQNDWTQTTGKHLNWIDGGDKKNRVNSEEFQKIWEEQTEEQLTHL